MLTEDVQPFVKEGDTALSEHDRVWTLVPDILAIASHEGCFRRVNPAFSDILGWTEKEATRNSLQTLAHPEQEETLVGQLENLGRGLPMQGFELRLRHKAGGYRWISWSATHKGDCLYLVGRDVTWEKEAAAAKHSVQGALYQAQKMEALGQLAGRISHDINNLLTSIVFGLDLLNRRLASGRVQELDQLIEVALTSAQRATDRTQQLLAFARKQPLDIRPVDVNQLIAQLLPELEQSLGTQNRLSVDTMDGLWLASSDRLHLENTLIQLMTNAREAMPEGGSVTLITGNVHLDAAATEGCIGLEPGDYVQITLKDNGIGMPQAVLERVFDPFFTTKPASGDVGLGLSMIYGFVRQVRGHVRIDSELGRGTLVRLYFPRCDGNEGAQ
ncbi:ATP-binding protein [Pseudomonas indica]|uniref:ATP-binding protein n=1 Tax=Pseudomonas indica TaxID=137658 RepID=UPI0023F7C37C|nr:ATP-binding protein [Pseudomonas indica]MBU3055838.1 PAS domain S-box protein [Pseudomonas indica]